MSQFLEVVLENCEFLEINENDILDYRIINAIPYNIRYQKLDSQDKYYEETEIVIELSAYDENGERKPYINRLLEWQDIVFFDFYDEENGPHTVYYTVWKDLSKTHDEENKYQSAYLDEKEGVLTISVIKS